MVNCRARRGTRFSIAHPLSSAVSARFPTSDFRLPTSEPMTSIWQDFQGHDAQIAMFRRAIGRGRLGQSYLFVGPSGIGKRTFARKLATCLFCKEHAETELEACGECPACRQMAASSYPDYYEVGLPEGKNEIPLELMIGKRDERGRAGLCHDIAMTPMAGSRRIGVINDAPRLNEEGVNSFLKTLEEPPAGALLILIAEQPGDVLPTIRSRCQIVSFQPLSEAVIAELLLAQGLTEDPSAARSIAMLSEGSLAMARRLVTPELQELRQAAREVFERRPFSAAEAGATLSKLIESAGDTIAQREATIWLARFLATFFRQVNRSLLLEDASDPQSRAFGERLVRAAGDETEAVERLGALTARVGDLGWQVGLYVQPRVCVETLFYDLGNCLRGEA